MTAYLVYDVFTETAFGGNPLAVIPDATGLDEALLQKIAREFNFSETTFVYPPADPAHTARVRIFTPTTEVPFAGHPTIGTAIALHDLGRPAEIVLELGVGPIPCRVEGRAARFTTARPLETWEGPPVEGVAAAAGLTARAVRTDRHAPVIASVGLPFAVAELASVEDLSAAHPVTPVFEALDKDWPSSTHFDLLLYVRDGGSVRARMFAPLDGVPEDPATGSAAAALGALLARIGDAPVELDIAQGVEMGRPSRIRVSAGPRGVTVAGSARKVMEGRLTL